MKNNKLLILFLIIGCSVACSKKDDLGKPLTGLGGDTWASGPIDKWLYDSLVVPDNIEVKYKWDQSLFDMVYTLVPPKEEKVIPAMRDVIQFWIKPYNAEAGDSGLFMKNYAPKQLVLSGSIAIDPAGQAVAGLAEGGLQILLFGINDFVPDDYGSVADMAHLIHHEFTHILNQKKAYPTAYNLVTPSGYTGDWTVTQDNPWTLGFVSNYSRKAPGEDIAELVSTMLVMGRHAYDSALYHPYPLFPDSLNNDDGISKLRQKEQIVVQYFNDSYHLDFYSLQTRVQAAITALTTP